MFCGNYEQLAKALIFYESPESTALWIETQPNLNSFYIIEEIIRLLHNFAAGAMTLVDHTRNEANKLDSVPQLSSFRNEYNEEIQRKNVLSKTKTISSFKDFAITCFILASWKVLTIGNGLGMKERNGLLELEQDLC